jgi:hypothetical protein
VVLLCRDGRNAIFNFASDMYKINFLNSLSVSLVYSILYLPKYL